LNRDVDAGGGQVVAHAASRAVASEAHLRRLVERFDSIRIRSITYSQVDQYLLSLLAKGLTIASANRQLALLRSAFNFRKRKGRLSGKRERRR
jgi:site-specific recombinase XerD